MTNTDYIGSRFLGIEVDLTEEEILATETFNEGIKRWCQRQNARWVSEGIQPFNIGWYWIKKGWKNAGFIH